MNIFLSWSGDKSKKVAELFNVWLKQVIQAVKPWVSSQDIKSGSSWHVAIQNTLNGTTYGIFCLTKDNKNAPWILFEAGAVSKGDLNNSVCTFLIDLTNNDLLKNPLSNFNHTSNSKESLKKLVVELNNKLGDRKIEQEVLLKSFEIYYPEFEKSINEINAQEPELTLQKTPDQMVLDEILTSVRKISKQQNESTMLDILLHSKEIAEQLKGDKNNALQKLFDMYQEHYLEQYGEEPNKEITMRFFTGFLT